MKGDAVKVKQLLDEGASLVVLDKNGWTALHLASSHGRMEVVQLLLDRGAPLDLQDLDGFTALYLAIKQGHKEVAQLLLDRGASLDLQDKDGKTALHMSSEHGRKEIVQLLLDKGASLIVQTKDGMTALHLAIMNGNKEVVQLLLDKGASLEVQGKQGQTAPHLASVLFHKEVVQLLLDNGVQLPNSALHDPAFLAILADFDEDQLGRVAAAQLGRCGHDGDVQKEASAVLMLVHLAGGARDRARSLRSSDPRGADEHQVLFARLQLAAAACIQYDTSANERGSCAKSGQVADDYGSESLLSSPNGCAALEKAVQIEAKELLSQPVVQEYVTGVWRGEELVGLADWLFVLVMLLLQLLFVLPIVALVPALDGWLAAAYDGLDQGSRSQALREKLYDLGGRRWFSETSYYLRLPIVKLGLEAAADLGLAFAFTIIPGPDLATAPAAPLLLVWVVSAIMWEGRQIATTTSTSNLSLRPWCERVMSYLLGTTKRIESVWFERAGAYLADVTNRIDALALVLSFATLVASLSAATTEDAAVISLRAVAVYLLWCRNLRVLLVSPTFGPYVLILFRMLFGDVRIFLVLLLFLVVPFAASFTVLLEPAAALLAQLPGDEQAWRWSASKVADLEAASCVDELGGVDMISTLVRLIESSLTGGDYFECARDTGAPAAAWTLALVFATIMAVLLLNMLIAMMAKTFDNISEASATNYLFLFTQRVLALQSEPPTPPPFYALSLPSKVFGMRWEETLWKARAPPPSPPPELAEVQVVVPSTATMEAEPKDPAEGVPSSATQPPSAEVPPLVSPEAGGDALQAAAKETFLEKMVPLAEKIAEYIIDHQDDVAQEERWRTMMKRDSAKSFREQRAQVERVETQIRAQVTKVETQVERAETQIRAQVEMVQQDIERRFEGVSSKLDKLLDRL